jgi:hypothetical protein
MRPVTATVGPLGAASANNIALSQTPAGSGAVTLNGSLVTNGVATLDNPRRILITTADTTTTFTVNGTTPTGALISESLIVAGGSSYTAQDFKTVTSITVNQGTTAAVTVGTNGIASTPWVRLDEWANSYVTIQCSVVGTVNYTVQGTMDDPNSNYVTPPPLPSALNWINSGDPAAVGATGNIATNFLFSPTFVRVVLNSGSGSVTATFAQADVVSR